jgi:hypothetical protein
MIFVDVIMAIWYGMRARQFGRPWFGWALLGFFVPDLAFLLGANALAFLLSRGTMQLQAGATGAAALGGMLIGILAGIVVGFKVLKPRVRKGAGRFVDCPFCGVRNLATVENCIVCGNRLGDEEEAPLPEATSTRSKSERPRS